MVELIAFGGHQNAAVNSVGKIRILDTDGPAGVNSSTLGVFGTGYCSEVVLAQLCSRYHSFLAEGSIWNGCGDPSSCNSR